jgi:hypothetical protein
MGISLLALLLPGRRGETPKTSSARALFGESRQANGVESLPERQRRKRADNPRSLTCIRMWTDRPHANTGQLNVVTVKEKKFGSSRVNLTTF